MILITCRKQGNHPSLYRMLCCVDRFERVSLFWRLDEYSCAVCVTPLCCAVCCSAERHCSSKLKCALEGGLGRPLVTMAGTRSVSEPQLISEQHRQLTVLFSGCRAFDRGTKCEQTEWFGIQYDDFTCTRLLGLSLHSIGHVKGISSLIISP